MTINGANSNGNQTSPSPTQAALSAALATLRAPAKQQSIAIATGGSDEPYNYWKATLETAPRRQFESPLAFFVNAPSLQGVLLKRSQTDKWRWQPLQPAPLSRQFNHRPEIVQLLRTHGGNDALMREGWLVNTVPGRIDPETTSSDNLYLIATDGYYAVIQLYNETIH